MFEANQSNASVSEDHDESNPSSLISEVDAEERKVVEEVK